MKQRPSSGAVGAGLLLLSAGCGPAYRNAPLQDYEPQAGYRFESLKRGEGNTDQVFVCLTFSGGGTRAAALAYGVLQELRETEIAPLPNASAPRRLLDEVDAISSVSGGSFTAAGYALWRDKLFDGRFERRFLRRNVQIDLIFTVCSFPNLCLLPLVLLDRIDIVADYFHDRLFERRTYADLMRQRERPFIAINATNMATGQRLEFTQDDFDILGSDLEQLPIAYAVAASQAVPVVFSPLRLKYYSSDPSRRAIKHVLTSPSREEKRDRRQIWARSLLPTTRPGEEPSYGIEARRHRYLYLLDGGVSDNLGLSYVIENYRDGLIQRRIKDNGEQAIRTLVVIIVNAGTKPEQHLEAHGSAPGILTMGLTAALSSIENYSSALTTFVRWGIVEESHRVREQYRAYRNELGRCCPDPKGPPPPIEERFRAYVIEVNFQDVVDDASRKRLMEVPTNYCLTHAQADEVISSARMLLRQNPDFQRLRQDLSTQPPPSGPRATHDP